MDSVYSLRPIVQPPAAESSQSTNYQPRDCYLSCLSASDNLPCREKIKFLKIFSSVHFKSINLIEFLLKKNYRLSQTYHAIIAVLYNQCNLQIFTSLHSNQT